MDLLLKGKRALITGGASGLGRELVRHLAAEGADVCFDYRSRAADAEALVHEIEALGVRVHAVHSDLSERDAPGKLFAAAVEALGGVDILVNNAGVWLTAYVGDIDDEVWDKTIDVNLRAPVWLSQLMVLHCKDAAHPGTILNVTSQAAFLGSTRGHAPYAITKAGLVNFTVSLARELAHTEITVNALAIGMMNTPMIADALATKGDYYRSRIPSGRVAEPDEIAGIATFLVSPRAGYMTGATVDVTGGVLMR